MARADRRGAAQIAAAMQAAVDNFGLGAPAPPAVPIASEEEAVDLYDTLVTETAVRDASRRLFFDGHYSSAVLEAFKCINNEVKRRAPRLTSDGAPLMQQALSIKDPHLKLNPLQTDSQRDQQSGYAFILAGCMTGIRNPTAHEHKYFEDVQVALEMLCMANHLARFIREAKSTRRKKP